MAREIDLGFGRHASRPSAIACRPASTSLDGRARVRLTIAHRLAPICIASGRVCTTLITTCRPAPTSLEGRARVRLAIATRPAPI